MIRPRDRPDSYSFQRRIELIKKFGDLRMEYAKRILDGHRTCQAIGIEQMYIVGGLELHAHVVAQTGHGVCVCVRDLTGVSDHHDFQKLPVFVYVGKPMEKLPKRESFVRLNRLDQCDLFIGEKSQATLLAPISFKDIRATVDRKLRALLLDALAVDAGRDKHRVVECSAQVMSKLADDPTSLVRNFILEAEKNQHPFYFWLSATHLDCTFAGPIKRAIQARESYPLPKIFGHAIDPIPRSRCLTPPSLLF